MAAGPHELTQGGRPGLLAAGGNVTAEARSGETVNVTLDVSSRALVPVRVTVTGNDLPVDGISVTVLSKSQPKRDASGATRRRRRPLGVTDKGGVVSGTALAHGPVEFRLRLPEVGTIVLSPPGSRWAQGSGVDVTLELPSASVLWILPDNLPLSEAGTLVLSFSDAEGDSEVRRQTQAVEIPVRDGALAPNGSGFVELEGRALRIKGLLPGSKDVVAKIRGAEQPVTQWALELQGTVELTAGEAGVPRSSVALA